MAGYIKLYRDIMNWEWYKDIPVRILFEHCLLKTNHEAKRWQGQIIEAGQFITSRETLAFETGLTEMQVRTALKKLKSTGEITSKTTSRYTIITINNWNLYQQNKNNQQNVQQITNKQPTNNQQITTNKNDKNEKNDKEVEEVVEEEIVEEKKQKELGDFYGEYKNVHLTKHQYDVLFTGILNEVILKELIEELSEAIVRGKNNCKPYDPKNPNKHFADLKAFWRFRREHPEKYMQKDTDSGGNGKSKVRMQLEEYFAKKECKT